MIKRALLMLSSVKITLTCIIFIFLLFVVCDIPEVQRWIIAWQTSYSIRQMPERLQSLLKNDPPLGFNLNKILGDKIAVPKDKPLLVCVFQNCEGCKGRMIQEWVETFSWDTLCNNLSFTLIVQGKQEQVKTFAERARKHVLIIADPRGKVMKALNSVFTPRAYGFVEGKLVWLQKEPGMSVVSILRHFLEISKGKEKAELLINKWSEEMREKLWGQTKPISKGNIAAWHASKFTGGERR